jgi:hypothetical protein
VALPMIVYIARPDSFYWSHITNYSDVSVTQTQEFEDAGALGKARLVGEQLRTFARAYAWGGERDYVDASGLRATFDWPTLALLAAGLVLAARRRREPLVIAALCCVLVIPLPALLQQGSITRQPLVRRHSRWSWRHCRWRRCGERIGRAVSQCGSRRAARRWGPWR